MREISSKDNKIFKLAKELLVKKYRDQHGLYLIEGENLVHEAVKCGQTVETVLIRPDYDKDLFGLEDKTFVIAESLFSQISETETSQGIIAIVEKPKVDLAEFKKGDGSNFLVLDRLQDPGNIGTIIRTADAAGYSLIIAIKGTADCFQSKVVRAATGSLFRVPVVSMASTQELVEFTRATGKKLVATAMNADCDYYDCDLTKDVAIVIGNEGNGISQELIESSDLKISIPMQGNIESLNASVAAGILLYERIRQCKKN